jgi:hypothetical protein
MPHPAPQDAREPDANLLTSAVERLHEWEALADAVPSLSLVVKLLNADSEDVTLSSAAWSLSVAVSSGHPSIEGAARHLKWSSYKTCKAVRELVDAGRATLVAPPRRRRRGSRIEAPAQSPGSWHAANRPLWPGTGGNDRDRFSQAWASEE